MLPPPLFAATRLGRTGAADRTVAAIVLATRRSPGRLFAPRSRGDVRSSGSSRRSPAVFRQLSNRCSGVSGASPQLQPGISTPGTRRWCRNARRPIFLVRICMSTELSCFRRPLFLSRDLPSSNSGSWSAGEVGAPRVPSHIRSLAHCNFPQNMNYDDNDDDDDCDSNADNEYAVLEPVLTSKNRL